MSVPMAAIIKASCIDGRERIADASLRCKMLAFDLVQRGEVQGMVADHIAQHLSSHGSAVTEPMINFYRPAASGGGWSESARRDLLTIKRNNLPVLMVISARHSTCGSLKAQTHLTDPDAAVMMVIDFHQTELPLPPVYRAHLEVTSKHMDFEVMNIPGLVAHAALNGTGPYLPTNYVAGLAAQLLGLPNLQSELQQLANHVSLGPKGLLEPSVRLSGVVH